MKQKKRINIDITLNKNTKIYNDFNNNQLSDELSNYIYNQCKGTSTKTNIDITIYHDFKIENEEKTKIIDSIRANYGIDIKENLLTTKYEHIKEVFSLFVGIILIIISNILISYKSEILGEIISIFGCVIVWEIAYNIFFVEISKRLENQRLEKLKRAKIIFIEQNEDNLN